MDRLRRLGNSIWSFIKRPFISTVVFEIPPTSTIQKSKRGGRIRRTLSWFSKNKNKRKIGFIGLTGTGKSTLINCLRNIFDENDPRYAKVSLLTASLRDEEYTMPKNHNITLIEFCDSSDIKIIEKNISSVDHVVIVVGRGFRETDLQLVLLAHKNGKEFSIVRMKLDQDVDNRSHRYHATKTCDELKEELRKDLKTNTLGELVKGGFRCDDQNNIFYVSEDGFRELHESEASVSTMVEGGEKALKERVFYNNARNRSHSVT